MNGLVSNPRVSLAGLSTRWPTPNRDSELAEPDGVDQGAQNHEIYGPYRIRPSRPVTSKNEDLAG